MSEPSVNVAAKEASVAKYNLLIFGYFALIITSQFVLARQYVRLLPEELRGLLNAIMVLGFGVQSSLFVAVIPLAMVFIFGWLYLSDIRVRVRQLYPIVVIAVAPLLVFYIGAMVFLLTARGIDPSALARMTVVSRQIQTEIASTNDATKVNPAHLEELGTLLKDDTTRRWKPIYRLVPLPLALSCLTCGWLLRRRLGIGPIRSYLIPTTFVLSVVLVRWSTSESSQMLVDRIKSMVQP